MAGSAIERAEGEDVSGTGDRAIWLVLLAMLSVSAAAQSLTRIADAARNALAQSAGEIVLLEVSSHVAIVVMAAVVPYVLSRAPFSLEGMARQAAAHVAGLAAFNLGHVALMAAIREVLFPAVTGGPYRFNLFAPENLAYELVKDVVSYTLIVILFVAGRLILQRRRETGQAADRARTQGILTLKSGTTTLFVPAGDVIYAKAAANYVEVQTRTKRHFVRMTLSELERQLDGAGGNHVRVHRSWIVHLPAIAAIVPNGEGDAEITLSGGEKIPASRNYRPRLSAAMGVSS